MARAKTPRGSNGKAQSATREIQLAAEAKTNVVPINLEEEIRRRAYELSEQRGFVPGHENEDWLNAEREITTRYHQQQRA
jgi:Protein of unknown function (DUF2934)